MNPSGKSSFTRRCTLMRQHLWRKHHRSKACPGWCLNLGIPNTGGDLPEQLPPGTQQTQGRAAWLAAQPQPSRGSQPRPPRSHAAPSSRERAEPAARPPSRRAPAASVPTAGNRAGPTTPAASHRQPGPVSQRPRVLTQGTLTGGHWHGIRTVTAPNVQITIWHLKPHRPCHRRAFFCCFGFVVQIKGQSS